jgi:hypothetical protein
MPADWRHLAEPAPAFAALYRLSCCGRSNLLATLRCGSERMSLEVVAPPGAKVLDAWFDGDRGWIVWRGQECRSKLPPGQLPLADDAALPLDVGLVALVLSGHVPSSSVEEQGRSGWVASVRGDTLVRARLLGAPARCAEIVLARVGDSSTLAHARLSQHHEWLPGTVRITAGDQTVELELVSWRGITTPEPPSWLARTECQASQ